MVLTQLSPGQSARIKNMNQLTRPLRRKLMVMGLVMLAAALDRLLGTQGVSRLAVIGFYAANEGLSIVENAALLGLPFPRGVLMMLEKMRDQETKEG